MSRDRFWRSISKDTNVEVSALSPEYASEPVQHASDKITNNVQY